MAEHGRDLRNDTAHRHLLSEQRAGRRERRPGRRLDPRARRVQQPDDGDALAEGQLADPRRLGLADGAHRAGQHREVVGADGDPAAVDGADPRHHAVRREVPPLGLEGRVHRVGQLTQLDERAGVEEEVEPLPDGQLAHAPLPLDLLLAAHGQRLRLPPLQVVDQGLPVVQVGLLGHVASSRAGL